MSFVVVDNDIWAHIIIYIMSWLKKLLGGGKSDQPHEGHENCEGGVCSQEKAEAPAEESAAEAAPQEEAPAEGGGEEAAEQGEEDKPL